MVIFPDAYKPHWVKSRYTLHGANNNEGSRGLGKIVYIATTSGTMYFSEPGQEKSAWRGVRYSGGGLGMGMGVSAPVSVSHSDVDYPMGGSDDFGRLYFEHKTQPFLDQLSDCEGILYCPGAAVTLGNYSLFGVEFWDQGRKIAYAWQRGTGVTVGTLMGVSLTRYGIKVNGLTRGAP